MQCRGGLPAPTEPMFYADDFHARVRRHTTWEELCCRSPASTFLDSVCAMLRVACRGCAWFSFRYQVRGHTGTSRSLTFAYLCACLELDRGIPGFPSTPEKWTRFLLFSYFFFVTASHGALDAMTDGGLGIAFFAPFDNTRYFFPFRPIKVSPIGLSFFSARGLDVIWSELFWLCVPAAIIAGAVLFYRKLRRSRAETSSDQQ